MKLKVLRRLAKANRRFVLSLKNKVLKFNKLALLFVIAALLIPHTTGVEAAQDRSDKRIVSSVAVTYKADIVTTKTKKVKIVVEPVEQQVVSKLTVASVTSGSPIAELSSTQKRELVKRAAKAWGVDWKILEAVWQVESGKQSYTYVSSYAGAQGPCQFMYGTWLGYAQDGNGDGRQDVYNAQDCLFGSAKLLAANGAASGDVTRALFAYNHSYAYVELVKSIARSIRG
ncbi:hypothetical protein A3A71_02260 [Candidatus Berkelbacteria bacterium RIFCSPLOWO2_01_FULL_50_28]|uniref:Transglycosylase SLT domain-containing protein n=1 Tax=Candidatus Berkelbacteria bacterium RIFCSPLOWO2_01_FULL_50_28 TaxID=1797471 RepID=A0A1F5EBR1_9BACT|nr:MAG: hypothetical protein A2807_00655 [Candidatus Berkelbacteria bacterium RIFCSPHIGHO2_01_FULL_50_36]OGD62205.1 MAG: hypothetical protein A3F39_00675 [Candidatus Berkelbacteria bacterium RIFCSPHIGHO2_12_FULL_50_11]OGD64847.1 MAG: hypothetical protein A3A71_02260 [Candidatus Berkelbacteria bacterium RIFCSPLOWO2_01_FULL_50_28]